ncbi:RraA family protein [Candidatus Poriferisodalis sp.]|uniref:RraA family protein n=1 Tax=Candidatus Poriferisodalis sp. TaxID=3101277 RepID=UPI003B52071D
MDTAPLSADVLEELRQFDTPTVCNALEIVAPQRRAYGYTTSPLVCPDPDTVMVGYARTATIRANAPSGRSGADDLAVRVGYYRHMAAGPQPTITVIEDIDASPGYGAWWGEVNSSIHAGLGSLGVITNGSIRDLGEWAPGFGALAGSIGPSHAWVHVVEYDVTVTVHGMTVRPGDLIHADRHGAVVVPADVAVDIPGAAAKIAAAERILIDAARSPDFSIDRLTALLDPKGDH